MTTPVLPPKQWPCITHSGNGWWCTLCEQCGESLEGLGIGATVSAHAVHITREHAVITCRTCGETLRYTGGVDQNVPWVHERSQNAMCDVDVPEDAVMFAGTPGRPFADPGEEGFDTPDEYLDYLYERQDNNQ